MDTKKLLLFIALLFLSGKAYVQVQECEKYPIPPEHLDYQSITAVSNEWASSGTDIFPISITPDRQFDVTDFGILPDMQPCGHKIQELIKNKNNEFINPPPSSDNPAMFYFPPGAYLIDKPLTLKGGVILKGAGGDGELPGQTHFHFDLSADYAHPCITIQGTNNGVEDIFIIDDTKCYIEIISSPKAISASIPLLIYEVKGASKMKTEIFGVCSGYGVVNNNKGTFKCSGIEPGLYDVTTTFSNSFDSKTVQHKIKVYSDGDSTLIYNENKKKSGQYQLLSTKKAEDITNGSYPDDFYQYTINISGSKNFIRGVESDNTRRFHIYISGDNNTISGCYFHHSISYTDDNGRGYGVCIAGYSKKNRVEDNILSSLRHSMVLQGDAFKNVIAYNYSRDVIAYNGTFPYPADDLCLHGRVSTSNGPKLNLLEGNIVVRSRVDDTHDFNGPYNTFFRNRTTDDYFKVYQVPYSWHQYQYAQNVIGCNMEPTSQTLQRLKSWGFINYYPDYSGIPSLYCSLYFDSEPAFFLGWIEWPYLPDENHIIPAKYRWDSHDPQWGYDEVPYAINQGWDDYTNLCGPPNYKLSNQNFNGESEQYLAMNEISLSNMQFSQDNNILFHAENRVNLDKGTIITGNNNHIVIKAGNVCGGGNVFVSKYAIYNNAINEEYLEKSSGQLTTEIIQEPINNTEFTIFPNPCEGREFFIKTNNNTSPSSIEIFDLYGKKMKFEPIPENNVIRIKLIENFKGLILLRVVLNKDNKIEKILIK